MKRRKEMKEIERERKRDIEKKVKRGERNTKIIKKNIEEGKK